MDRLNVDLKNFRISEVYLDDDPNAIVHIRLMTWFFKYKQHKACKERNKQIINACSILSNKMVGQVHVRRW